MKKITKKTLLLIIIFVYLSGCQGLRDGLEGNKKSKSAEEFLIEKKKPLMLPPEFNKLPKPGNLSSEDSEETDFNIDKILGKKKNKSKNSINSSQSVLEKSIIKEIKKN
jgi:hypothetical protein